MNDIFSGTPFDARWAFDVVAERADGEELVRQVIAGNTPVVVAAELFKGSSSAFQEGVLDGAAFLHWSNPDGPTDGLPPEQL